VLAGTWFRQCAIQEKRLTIERMRDIAQERGGQCLSGTYVNNRSKLIWECHLVHVWSSAPDTVVNWGSWCPNCYRLKVTK
jgi:hypothetical protein